MRKSLTILTIGVSALLFTACGSSGDTGGNTPPASTTVNLVGTWSDKFVTKGSICDGIVANYIVITEPYNGDPNVMGAVNIDGTFFDVDSRGNCYLAPIHKVDTTYVGTPSNMTKDQYVEFQRQRLAGIGTIDSFNVINFNPNIISVETKYTNGVVLYTDAVRQ